MYPQLTEQIQRVRELLDQFEQVLPTMAGFGAGPDWCSGGLRSELRLLDEMLASPYGKAPRKSRRAAA